MNCPDCKTPIEGLPLWFANREVALLCESCSGVWMVQNGQAGSHLRPLTIFDWGRLSAEERREITKRKVLVEAMKP